MKVKDCMCTQVCYCTPQNTVQDCAKLMNENHVGCIPVCDDKKNIVGIVTDRDLILRTVACNKQPANTPISEVMTCNTCCCSPDTTVEDAEQLMCENQIRRIPVLNNNQIVGILTIGDLAKNKNISCTQVAKTIEDICCNKNGQEKNNE